MKWSWDDLPYYLLMLFAVVSGQIARLGHTYERTGTPPTFGKVAIELSMLPAFASIGGALAAQHQWPIWGVIGCGLLAGWLGFALFKMAGEAAVFWLRSKMSGGGEKK